MKQIAHAPGKAMLLGEYAVLEGAPALVTAVDRRANAMLRPIDAHEIRVHAAEGSLDAAVIDLQREGWRWRDPKDALRLRLVHEVLRALLPENVTDVRGFELHLDTAQFFARYQNRSTKLGLGSSAALTVACAAAVGAHVAQRTIDAHDPGWQARVHAIHRALQDGQGSGADVAASLRGGSLRYVRSASGATSEQPLRWPASLRHRFVWTGRAASTPRMLSRLAAFKRDHAITYSRSLSRLIALAEEGAAALSLGRADAVMKIADRYATALGALDEASGLGIVSPEHARLRRLGRDWGLVYKSCGAGGGDLGVALSEDPDRLRGFDAAVTREGFLPLPLSLDAPGLCCETRDTEVAA